MTPFRLDRLRHELEEAGLLEGVDGTLPELAGDITDDSRLVRPGGLFVAVRGSERDGHDFLHDAEARGAAAAIVEARGRTTLPALVVRDGRRATPLAAAVAFDQPARSLSLVAVTGTNGKTTTVGVLRHLLDRAGSRAASIGTLGTLVGSAGEPLDGPATSALTTPGPVELQRVLRQLADAGVRSVAMEVSSHSLDQRRVDGLRFRAAVFTTFTRDHLDYHATMDAYFESKAKLLDHLTTDGYAAINADDAAWAALPTPRRVIYFGAGGAPPRDVWAERIRWGQRGSEWELTTRRLLGGRWQLARAPVSLPLIGEFNVSNALAAAAAAFALDVPADEIAERLSSVPQVPGRLEVIHEEPVVLRDYAHTPDALARALDAVRPFTAGRLIVVFGCGGDRDRGKRPEMGAIAEQKADYVILTSDNPRTEDPERILDDVEAGMHISAHERITERREAIARSLEVARPDDVVLLAGKGHETYQIRGTTKVPFDERLIVRELSGAGT